MMTSSETSQVDFEYCPLHSSLGDDGSENKFYGQYTGNVNYLLFILHQQLPVYANI